MIFKLPKQANWVTRDEFGNWHWWERQPGLYDKGSHSWWYERHHHDGGVLFAQATAALYDVLHSTYFCTKCETGEHVMEGLGYLVCNKCGSRGVSK